VHHYLSDDSQLAGRSTPQVIGHPHVHRAAEMVTDWWKEFHDSWTTAMEQPANWDL